jgi:hypothetical protein
MGGHRTLTVREAAAEMLASTTAADLETRGESALHMIAFGGTAAEVEAAVAAGADPNARRKDGITPLILAARIGNLDTIRALLAAGADPNIKAGKIRAVDAARKSSQPAAVAVLEAAMPRPEGADATRDKPALTKHLESVGRELGAAARASAESSGDHQRYVDEGDDLDALFDDYWTQTYRVRAEAAYDALPAPERKLVRKATALYAMRAAFLEACAPKPKRRRR